MKSPVRKSAYPQPLEIYLGIAILLLIALIATLIFFEQFRYDIPDFTTGNTLYETSGQPSSEILTKSILSFNNMEPLSSPETFNAENLSEKINGKAELYLSAGFKSLACQRYKKPDDPDLWLETFIYDMGNIINSFAVYSMQRRESSLDLDASKFSYKTENAIFFIWNNYYVEIVSSKPSEFLMDSMVAFAKDFIKKTGGKQETISELNMFPTDNLDTKSISLLTTNAFGFDRLNMVFTADYKIKNNKIKAFISKRADQLQAKDLAKNYSEFLAFLGGQTIKPDIKLDDLAIIEIMGEYEIIFTNGSFLAGIHSAKDLNDAKDLAFVINNNLEKNSHAR
ncbi:MAG: DUF6599 family protein [Pseudomonadota bacterium]